MNKTSRFVRIGIIASLSLTGLLLAQAPQAPKRPAPGRPAGPGPALGAPPQAGFGTRVLKTRTLEDKQLETKDQKKYESLIAAMEKRAATAKSSGASSSTAELSSAFRLASTQLHYGQEQAARNALEKAWDLAPALYGDPKTAMAATGQIRTHLKDIQTIAVKDPELALTFMTELAAAHTKAFDAIKQDKAKGQLVQPLAQTWALLMDMGQLDKDPMEKGAFWVLKYPQVVIIDRPIPPDARAEYDSELTQVNINITGKLTDLAQHQLARPGQPANPNINLENVDRGTAEALLALDAKRGPITRFMEADIQFKFGQFRRGLETTMAGWKELLEVYRANPRSVTPADAFVHFETLDRIAGLNPIQALIVLEGVDQAYRTTLQVNRNFGTQVADLWSKVSSLPLPQGPLAKAVFWLEHASKQNKEMENKYATPLKDLKQKYDQVKGDSEDDDDDKGKDDDDKNEKNEKEDKDDAKEQKNVGGRRGLNVPKTIDTLKRQGN